jgi:6,7-dimethyl-8-ribityllumazine synthase
MAAIPAIAAALDRARRTDGVVAIAALRSQIR